MVFFSYYSFVFCFVFFYPEPKWAQEKPKNQSQLAWRLAWFYREKMPTAHSVGISIKLARHRSPHFSFGYSSSFSIVRPTAKQPTPDWKKNIKYIRRKNTFLFGNTR
jgi:hypothetical protein